MWISPLVLTVFCSQLQFVDNYTVISNIMDILIIEGWVGFFKIFVYIFIRIEKELIKKEYDKILEFLNKKIYNFIHKLKIQKNKKKILSINIDSKMIKKFEIEYDRSRKIVD